MIKIELEKINIISNTELAENESLNRLYFDDDSPKKPLLLIPYHKIDELEHEKWGSFISKESAGALNLLTSIAEEYEGLIFVNIAREWNFLRNGTIDVVFLLDKERKNELNNFFEQALYLTSRFSFAHIIKEDAREKLALECESAHKKFKEKGLDFIVERSLSNYVLHPTQDGKYRINGYSPIDVKLMEYAPQPGAERVRNNSSVKYCSALFGVGYI